jgi:hypothetical protein
MTRRRTWHIPSICLSRSAAAIWKDHVFFVGELKTAYQTALERARVQALIATIDDSSAAPHRRGKRPQRAIKPAAEQFEETIAVVVPVDCGEQSIFAGLVVSGRDRKSLDVEAKTPSEGGHDSPVVQLRSMTGKNAGARA